MEVPFTNLWDKAGLREENKKQLSSVKFTNIFSKKTFRIKDISTINDLKLQVHEWLNEQWIKERLNDGKTKWTNDKKWKD